jgi:uncharacterized membrane protein YdjX (TVP38/TMEM64 family)
VIVVKKTRENIVNVLLVLMVLSAFAALTLIYFDRYDRFSRTNVEAFIASFGAWAPLIYAALYIISSPVPFLAPVLSAVGGLLFGALWGTVYTLIIATVSSLVPFVLARRLGREWVAAKLEGKRLEHVYRQSEGDKGFLFILLMRLIPVLPWEVQNYVGGLTRVRVPTYMAATILGIIPGTFSLTFLGAAVTRPGSWEFYAAIALKIATAAVPAVYTLIRHQRMRRRQVSTPSDPEAAE